jgi:hypothetical protein
VCPAFLSRNVVFRHSEQCERSRIAEIPRSARNNGQNRRWRSIGRTGQSEENRPIAVHDEETVIESVTSCPLRCCDVLGGEVGGKKNRNAWSAVPGVSFSSCHAESKPLARLRSELMATGSAYFFLATFFRFLATFFLATFFFATFFLVTFFATFFFAFFLATFRPPNKCSGRNPCQPSGWGRNWSGTSPPKQDKQSKPPSAFRNALSLGRLVAALVTSYRTCHR